MKDPRQVRLVVIFAFAFLVLWVVHNNILLKTSQRQLSDNQKQQLNLLGQMILPELESQLEAALEDPFLVYSLASEKGAARIVLLDRDGVVQVDSQGEVESGGSLIQLGIERSELLEVGEGTLKLTAPYRDGADTHVRSLFLPIHDPDGLTAGIVRISIEVPPPGEMSGAVVTSLLLKLFGSVLVIVVAYIVIRSFRASQRRTTEELGETGTVVETFHGLVRQLKEKEQELEKLKLLAEQRAADVESYNENILQSVASGVITFDRNRQITTFNPAAQRVLGMTREEAVEKSCEQVFGKGSPIDKMLGEVLDREITISRQEFELQRPVLRIERGLSRSFEVKGQERIWVGVSTSLLRDRQGQVIGATFVFTDLTEIKYLQEQVELKRRLTVLGEMSAGIAHEFRNFMGTIMGFAKLIGKRIDPEDPRQNMVQAITREIQAMDHLIEQLLHFGRHAELSLAPVDLEPFLHKEILHVMAQVADHAHPKLKLEIPAGLPHVMMDEVLMRQALSNLLQNALEAMPHGGELRVAMRVLERGGSTGKGSGEMALEISDTGIGIPRDRLDKIFLPFFTTKEKGTGMGLALAHKIILSHNGRIEVNSTEGRGTTFRIYLPLRDARSEMREVRS